MKLTSTLLLCGGLLLIGCSTTPTAFDRSFAEIRTNYVPVLVLQTNVVTVTRTNLAVDVVTITNSVGVPVPVFVTNLVASSVPVTNYLIVTNLTPVIQMTPSTNAVATASLIGAAVNNVVPGFGSLITEGLLGALAVFLGFRARRMSGQNNALSQVAGTLAQTIETAREVMSKTPQGQEAANAFTQWMVSHQAETNTIADITNIVRTWTNNTEAQAAAAQILALINKNKPQA